MLYLRRASFWGAVAVVSVVSQFALEAITTRVPSAGLAKFTEFAHKGSS